MNDVPTLTSLLYRAFLTIRRSKNIQGSTFYRKEVFLLASLKSEKLKEYTAFFGFKGALPISYFYLISQRIQTALMVEKEFPLPIPGMIHIRTQIELLNDPVIGDPIEIDAEVSIENKEEGSLLPEFKEVYLQNGLKIAKVKSTYLVKRKSKNAKKKKRVNSIIENTEQNWLVANWQIEGSNSFSYAKLSGDFNPIHISSFFALLAGFKGKIIHGWYMGSIIISTIETETNMPAKAIDIQFIDAIDLPKDLTFEFRLGHNRNLEFRIADMKGEQYYISGILS